MAPTQQDSFIDDSDDACPLCVEEFDLSDKNFKPCPCGYQVCQFCFNNIKNNMNGLCPACRRPYDEKNIEWKVVSPEEVARFKAEVALQAKKKAVARQKEVQKREVETLNRKHLAGLRVVQKNLVYVVGLNPRIREEDLLQTLRGDQYFGQYGKIIKIVVSKKDGAHSNQSMGVYVTFERKQDAASCIAAVDGSRNGERTLRAQYGTTKYCSAYLRNEQCTNRNCMFLHEPGEENDSFTRQDLSSLNVVSTQQPAQATASSSSSTRQSAQSSNQPPQPPTPPQQASQTVVAATQAMARQSSKDGASSVGSGDGSALPSSASWASKGVQPQRSSTASRSASASSSPKPKMAAVNNEDGKIGEENSQKSKGTTEVPSQQPAAQDSTPPANQTTIPTFSTRPKTRPLDTLLLNNLLKSVSSPNFVFTFSSPMLSSDDLAVIMNYPPLFDSCGGAKRRKIREQHELERRRQEEEVRNTMSVVSAMEEDESPEMGGSLQLGGEPETRPENVDLTKPRAPEQQRHAIQPPSQQVSDNNSYTGFDQDNSLVNNFSNLTLHGSGLTHQQRQQLLAINDNQSGQQSAFSEQYSPSGLGGLNINPQPSQPHSFQNQSSQLSTAQGHVRQSSRYSFANDTASASAAVKPAANAKLMAQQSAMMPTGTSGSSNSNSINPLHQQPSHPFFGSGMQGPPPGFKSLETPPLSGGGMFGQGHGFGGAMVGGPKYGGSNMAKKDDLMRDLLHSRGGARGAANGQELDAGKREFMFPSLYHHPSASTPVPASDLLSSLYGHLPGAYQDSVPQRQKKKGKKHRHANTSSSGGGGIVDLGDPSILQARMHPGGAGAAHGLFGGQGQGDQDFPAFDVVSTSIDALVGDGGTSGPSTEMASSLPSDTPKASSLSKSAGQALPHAHPLPVVVEQAPQLPVATELASAANGPAVITPTVPIVPFTATPQPPTSGRQESQVTHELPPTLKTAVPDTKSKPQEPKVATYKAEEFPALAPPSASSSTHLIEKKEAKFTEGKGKEKVEHEGVKSVNDKPPNVVQSTTKRQHPGKLDIAAATEASKKDMQVEFPINQPKVPTSLTKNTRPVPNTTSAPSRPSTPGVPSARISESPVARQTQPKTIRVVRTPNTEISNPISASSSTLPTPLTAALMKPTTRQPNVASMNIPGTPASEIISDNASMTSTSLSRPGSPVLGKIGSAPTRSYTKNQQKKQRQERAKTAEDNKKLQETCAKPANEEPVQAPIIGRKKKTKKPASSIGDGSTPAISRPPSPTIDEQGEKDSHTEPKQSDRGSKKGKTRAEDAKNVGISDQSIAAPTPTTSSQKPAVTAASIIAELQHEGEIDPTAYDLFSGMVGINHRYEFTPSELQGLHHKATLTKQAEENLAQGLPVHITSPDGKYPSRTMISRRGRFLRGLHSEQEQRYLELEERDMTTKYPFRFNPSTENAFAALGPNLTLPQSDAVSATIVRKSAGDVLRTGEALDLVNSFLLPGMNRSQAPYDGSELLARGDRSQDFAIPGGANSGPDFAVGTGLHPAPSVEEMYEAMMGSRKETEAIEKRLNTLMKKNRKMMQGAQAA